MADRAVVLDPFGGGFGLADVGVDLRHHRFPADPVGLGLVRTSDLLRSAATEAGWFPDELRKIGFDAPAWSRPVAGKSATAKRPTNGANGATNETSAT